MKDTFLERQLYQLSEVEIKARDKKLTVDYGKFEQVSRTGKAAKLYLMNVNRENNPVFPFQFHPNIVIMRHTRFVPVKPHVHDWIELCYIFDGGCVQTINLKKKLELKKGQVILLNPNAVHSIEDTNEKDILINILIEKRYFDDIFFMKLSEENILVRFLLKVILEKKFHNNYILFHSENSERLSFYMKEMMKEFMTAPSENSKSVIENLLSLIFLELVDVYQEELIFNEMSVGKNCIAIMKYIEANYRNCTLHSVANVFCMNPNYLSNMLKQKIGYSFKELIQYYRLNYVSMMLCSTDEPVEQIIRNAGCENMTYFYKKFKEKFGCTPGEYRESNKIKL